MFFALLCVAFLPVNAEAKAKQENKKYAAFVLDADTGLILHQENATKPLHPASLTKMMTLLMAFDALDRGVLKLNDRIRISKHAASMEPSKLGLKAGSSIRVEDAILALVTKSANDIAVAVGERLGGTETNFGVMMTRKARAFGMKSTTFVNASGLHNPKQITTARDMARLGLVLIKNYKRHYHYFSTVNFSYQGKSYHNHNRLMQSYEGMDGLKTGFIQPSGFNLVASAKRDGRRLIGVVFGGKTAKSRNDRMAQVLNEGFAKIGTLNVAEADTRKSVKTQSVAALEGEDDPTPPSQMGQGDFDSSVRSSRVETGMMAVAAVTGTPRKQGIAALQKTPEIATLSQPQTLSLKPPRQTLEPPPKLQHKLKVPQHYTTNQGGEWAIQVGAYTSRESSNKALNESLKRLPASMRNSNPVVAPVQTAQGWIFRARLSGFTKDAARKACALLAECIPIAPHATR